MHAHIWDDVIVVIACPASAGILQGRDGEEEGEGGEGGSWEEEFGTDADAYSSLVSRACARSLCLAVALSKQNKCEETRMMTHQLDHLRSLLLRKRRTTAARRALSLALACWSRVCEICVRLKPGFNLNPNTYMR